MRAPPVFSVVIPTFNSAAVLQGAFDSIANQRYDRIEVLVIDGKSSDGTLDIASARDDLHISIRSEADQGIYDAINKGVADARGDLVVVLGSDDRFLPNALDNVAAAWRSGEAQLIAGGALLMAADGSHSPRADEEFGPAALVSGIPFSHNAMFASAELYRQIGPYDLRYRICADAHWVHRAIRARTPFKRLRGALVEFGYGGKSTVSDELIMRESYAVICENFPSLDPDEAEHLLRAVRGWNDAERVEDILARHRHDTDLVMSAALAFLGRARRCSGAPAAVSAPAVNATAIYRRLLGRAGRLLRG